MKIWNEEVEDCLACIYASNVNGVNVCSQPKFFNKMFKLNKITYSKEKGHNVQEIPNECPFKQPITKEFIENELGFGYYVNNIYSKLINGKFYLLSVNGNEDENNISLSVGDEDIIVEIETNPEHLKFILKSLNIC